jgi:NO-binding membrane sensor protein with MHYT domain
MTRPDLGTAEGRRAYVMELREVAIGWRIAGLGIVALGAAGLIATRLSGGAVWHSNLGIGSVATLVVGWAVVITAVVKRTRYHRRRMAG